MRSPDVEALADALDGTAEPGSGELASLTALATALRGPREPAPAPRPEFREALRAQLVAAARERTAVSPTLLARLRGGMDEHLTRWRTSARLAAASAAGALALSSGGVALAAERSAPSDALYPVKLALEDVRLALVGGGAARAERAFSYADDRLAEVRAAAARGDMEAAARALSGADERVREGATELAVAFDGGAEPAALDRLTDLADRQRAALAGLHDRLWGPALVAEAAFATSLGRISVLPAVLLAPPCDCRGAWSPGMPIPAADEPFVPCPCVVTPTDGAAPAAPVVPGSVTGEGAGPGAAADPPAPAGPGAPAAGCPAPQPPAPVPEPAPRGGAEPQVGPRTSPSEEPVTSEGPAVPEVPAAAIPGAPAIPQPPGDEPPADEAPAEAPLAPPDAATELLPETVDDQLGT